MNKPWLRGALYFLGTPPSFFSLVFCAEVFSVLCICIRSILTFQLYAGPTLSERQSKQLPTAVELRELQHVLLLFSL